MKGVIKMDAGKLSIQKLNGKNVYVWSIQIEAVLSGKGLLKYVNTEFNLVEEEQEKQKMNECRAIIFYMECGCFYTHFTKYCV